MLGLELSPARSSGPPLDSAPLASYFASGGGAAVALAAGADGDLSIWTEVGPEHAAIMRFDSDDPNTRFSWRETLIAQMRSVYPLGSFSTTGSWSQLQSSGSGLNGSYTGNRAISTTSTAAVAHVTVDRAKPYDLWVHYTARTNGAYVKVEIDGAQTLVNEIGDPAALGFKAFSAYGASDLQRRQTMKVASGLTGPHDIALSIGADASPGGNAIMIEAVSITGDLGDPGLLPPLWEAGKTYAMGDEVQAAGLFYSARANGVSGATAPSHGSGIASDGALDWRVDNRPTYPEFVAIDYASEREYAARFTVGAAVTEVGGQTHGNEPRVARTITLNGAPWVPPSSGSGLSIGQDITITEDTTWQTQSGDDVAVCTLARRITPGVVQHDVRVNGIGPQVDIEWLYAGMLPMVRWDGESSEAVFDRVVAPSAVPVVLDDYAGQTPPNIEFDGAARVGLDGVVKGRTITCGIEAGALALVGNLIQPPSAFVRPNLDGHVASGSLDWGAKAYITGIGDAGQSFGNGDVLGFFNRHVIAVR